MQYAIIVRFNEYTVNGNALIPRSSSGPFVSREEAEKYNSLFPRPEYNLIVPFHDVEED